MSKRHSVLTTMSFALFLSCGITQAQAQADAHEHEHAHAEHGAATLSLNDGQPWATDAALRDGMTSIRSAVESAAPQFAAGQLSQSQAQQLYEAVQSSVMTMIQQCKLEPAADENLHTILGMLLAAADTVAASPQSAEGVPALQGALEAYAHYFSHAGWGAVDHHEHAH